MITPLLGHNLVRLVYLDEAGISKGEPAICVAGVLVNGDFQSAEVEQRMDGLVADWIPPSDRLNFVFHATDLYHGSGYFDREVWPLEIRLEILLELAGIITAMKLPIVAGTYRKEKFGLGVLTERDLKGEAKRVLIQTLAAMDCAIWADRWLEKYAPHENAVIIAEDTDRVKPLMKKAIKVLRSSELIKLYGLEEAGQLLRLPLKRIVDTVHFAAKPDARALQLADLCAFIIGRAVKDKPVPLGVFKVIWTSLRWLLPPESALNVEQLLQQDGS